MLCFDGQLSIFIAIYSFSFNRRCIYAELQNFVQLDLRDLLRRAVKKNLDIVKMIAMSVREMCVEWKDGVAPLNDPALQGNKDPKTGFNIEVDLHSCQNED